MLFICEKIDDLLLVVLVDVFKHEGRLLLLRLLVGVYLLEFRVFCCIDYFLVRHFLFFYFDFFQFQMLNEPLLQT